MMLNTNSRYEPSTAADGTIIAVRKPLSSERYSLYTVKAGDTIESLAVSVFGDPTLYWRIADMNPQLDYPDSLTPGDLIRLPE